MSLHAPQLNLWGASPELEAICRASVNLAQSMEQIQPPPPRGLGLCGPALGRPPSVRFEADVRSQSPSVGAFILNDLLAGLLSRSPSGLHLIPSEFLR